jgi:NDP-sugar pyrophosphorylase family protein
MSNRATILAGGRGSRLAPYTTVLPKPLMPIGDRAILDVLVRQLASAGFTELTFAVGYLGHLIRAVFGDGSTLGVSIDYHDEPQPLGTAGPLAGMAEDDTLLVLNGDLLTALDFRVFFDVHREHSNAMTIATHRRKVKIDYGVLHVAGTTRAVDVVTDYEEKPELAYVVSMGVYALEPRALALIPEGERFDIPDLVLKLLEQGEPVGSWLYDGYWLDIGRHDDYEQALEDYESVLPRLLPEPEVAAE